MKYRVKESVIETYLISEIKRNFADSQIHKYEARRGEPDRIILLPVGRAVFVETKRPGGKPRPEQLRALARLNKLGFEAFWLPTRKHVDIFISYLKGEIL